MAPRKPISESFALIQENSYGIVKRLEYVSQILLTVHARQVLDIGCGTGDLLVRPLAERFPAVAFLGFDDDARTIACAVRRCGRENLEFTDRWEVAAVRTFDTVIMSEVLEHVLEPQEFLERGATVLKSAGHLVVTVPNGYGAFECLSVLKKVLDHSGILSVMQAGQTSFTSQSVDVPVDTCANSPHVNFFSYGELLNLFRMSSLQVVDYRPRSMLCGFGVDRFVRGRYLLTLNNLIPEYFGPWCASDWMFLLRKAPSRLGLRYACCGLSRFRRNWNLRRALLGQTNEPRP